MNKIAKILLEGIVIVAVVLTPSCGNKQDPNPAPAPAPPSSPPGGNPGFGGCGNIGTTGQALSQYPYSTQLTRFGGYGYFGQNGVNSLSDLRIFFTNFSRAEDFEKSIVASGNLSYPDLLLNNSYYSPPNLPFNFCVSSGNYNGPPTPGTFDQRYNSLRLSLRGVAQVPLYSQYSGYPGGYWPGNSGYGPQGQELVEVDFGSYCPAILYNGKVRCIDQCPCVVITIGGSRGVPMPYLAQ